MRPVSTGPTAVGSGGPVVTRPRPRSARSSIRWAVRDSSVSWMTSSRNPASSSTAHASPASETLTENRPFTTSREIAGADPYRSVAQEAVSGEVGSTGDWFEIARITNCRLFHTGTRNLARDGLFADNLLRQVVYGGLREDKPARDVRREVPHEKPGG